MASPIIKFFEFLTGTGYEQAQGFLFDEHDKNKTKIGHAIREETEEALAQYIVRARKILNGMAKGGDKNKLKALINALDSFRVSDFLIDETIDQYSSAYKTLVKAGLLPDGDVIRARELIKRLFEPDTNNPAGVIPNITTLAHDASTIPADKAEILNLWHKLAYYFGDLDPASSNKGQIAEYYDSQERSVDLKFGSGTNTRYARIPRHLTAYAELDAKIFSKYKDEFLNLWAAALRPDPKKQGKIWASRFIRKINALSDPERLADAIDQRDWSFRNGYLRDYVLHLEHTWLRRRLALNIGSRGMWGTNHLSSAVIATLGAAGLILLAGFLPAVGVFMGVFGSGFTGLGLGFAATFLGIYVPHRLIGGLGRDEIKQIRFIRFPFRKGLGVAVSGPLVAFMSLVGVHVDQKIGPHATEHGTAFSWFNRGLGHEQRRPLIGFEIVSANDPMRAMTDEEAIAGDVYRYQNEIGFGRPKLFIHTMIDALRVATGNTFDFINNLLPRSKKVAVCEAVKVVDNSLAKTVGRLSPNWDGPDPDTGEGLLETPDCISVLDRAAITPVVSSWETFNPGQTVTFKENGNYQIFVPLAFDATRLDGSVTVNDIPLTTVDQVRRVRYSGKDFTIEGGKLTLPFVAGFQALQVIAVNPHAGGEPCVTVGLSGRAGLWEGPVKVNGVVAKFSVPASALRLSTSAPLIYGEVFSKLLRAEAVRATISNGISTCTP